MESTTTTSSFRSLPANYVTLVQLRERWFKERRYREDVKQFKDDQAESDCVGIAGEEETRRRSTANEEVQLPPKEIGARAGESCSRVSSANRGTGKWFEQRTRERREVGGGSRAEKSDGLDEKPEAGPKSRVPPLGESTGYNPRSRQWSSKRETGERNGGARHGNRSEHNCLDVRDEIESGSKPEIGAGAGAGSVSNVPEHKADSEPKDGVLAVNGGIRKDNTGIRRIIVKAVAERNRMNWDDDMEPNYSGYIGKKKGQWGRRNWEVGSGSKSESNGFDLEAGIEPKDMVTSMLGGNYDTGMNPETGIEKMVESHIKDQRPELQAWSASANGGLKNSGEKEFVWARKKGKNREFRGGSSKNLDREADVEPKGTVMSVHGGFWRDDGRGVSLESGIEKTVERHGKNQSDEIRPELKALSVNRGLKKNGKKEELPEKKNRKGRKIGGGSGRNLDMEADIEPRGVFWRDDDIGVTLKSGIEKTVERHGKDQSDEIRPELKALSANEGLKKNGKKVVGKGQKFGGGNSNNLDHAAVGEPKLMVMSVHGGIWRNDEKDLSPETGIEKAEERHGKDQCDEIRPKLKALSMNEGRKKNGEKEDAWERKNKKGGKFGRGSSNDLDQASVSEPKLMVMPFHGGFWRNGGKDTSLERNRVEQTAEFEPESVNKGLKKKKKSKKKKGPRTRESENGQTIVEGTAEASASLEVGVEPMVEEKRDDQRVGTETEPRTLSVNEGIRKKNGKKKQGGGRNMETWKTRGETRPDSEPKVGVLSANDSVREDNRAPNRNGVKEVTQEGELKTKIARNGSKKSNEGSKKPNDCDQLTVTGEDNGGASIRNSEKVESQGSGIKSDVGPEFKALSGIGGTRNETDGFRRKRSRSQRVGYRESCGNVPGIFRSGKKVLGKEDGFKVWVKKEELTGLNK